MHGVDWHHVGNRVVCPRGAAINPVVGSHCLQVNVRTCRSERGADGFHCSSLTNKGERNSHFFPGDINRLFENFALHGLLAQQALKLEICARAAANSFA